MQLSYPPCVACRRPVSPGAFFCAYCGTYVLDARGTTVVASRFSRFGAFLLNGVLFILTLGVGWLIWWFIVAKKGQNPGKAIVGLRVIKAKGTPAGVGTMLLRGLMGLVLQYGLGLIFIGWLDPLWLLWDDRSQTLRDKLVDTLVVRARGSEHFIAANFDPRLEGLAATGSIVQQPSADAPVGTGSASG